jgi:hypothetical protein
MREGWTYIVTHAPVATILGINLLWATGGGAIESDCRSPRRTRLRRREWHQSDSAVAAFYFAGGFGLFFGMMIARRLGAYFELKKNDRVHRLESVYSGRVLCAVRCDADARVVVCDGCVSHACVGRGVCRSGNFADASGSRLLARQSVDQRSRGRNVDLGVLDSGCRLVAAHNLRANVNGGFRSAFGNRRTLWLVCS